MQQKKMPRFAGLRIFIPFFTILFLLSGCNTFPSSNTYSELNSTSDISSEVDTSVEENTEPESSSDTEPSGENSEDPDVVEDPASSVDSSETSSQEESLLPPPDTDDEAFNEKFAQNSIDAAYEEEIAVAVSVTEMVEICQQYTDFWSAEVDNAYMHLLAVADEDRYADYRAEQEEWIAGKDGEIAEITEAAQAEGGSMALLNGASQVMNYYRDRAMALNEELYQYDPDFEFSFQANG